MVVASMIVYVTVVKMWIYDRVCTYACKVKYALYIRRPLLSFSSPRVVALCFAKSLLHNAGTDKEWVSLWVYGYITN